MYSFLSTRILASSTCFSNGEPLDRLNLERGPCSLGERIATPQNANLPRLLTPHAVISHDFLISHESLCPTTIKSAPPPASSCRLPHSRHSTAWTDHGPLAGPQPRITQSIQVKPTPQSEMRIRALTLSQVTTVPPIGLVRFGKTPLTPRTSPTHVLASLLLLALTIPS